MLGGGCRIGEGADGLVWTELEIDAGDGAAADGRVEEPVACELAACDSACFSCRRCSSSDFRKSNR